MKPIPESVWKIIRQPQSANARIVNASCGDPGTMGLVETKKTKVLIGQMARDVLKIETPRINPKGGLTSRGGDRDGDRDGDRGGDKLFRGGLRQPRAPV